MVEMKEGMEPAIRPMDMVYTYRTFHKRVIAAGTALGKFIPWRMVMVTIDG
jgi:hypothetical protein